MAVITAKGKTEFGEISVRITGETKVSEIVCEPERYRTIFESDIDSGRCWMANGYYPDPGTMLQAYACCCTWFGYGNVAVNGKLPEMEYEKGVIY